MLKNFILLFTVTTILFLMISCGSENQAQENKEPVKAETNEPTAVEKSTTTTTALENIDSKLIFSAYDTKGTLHESTEWIGKQPVVINFWGVWCPPCRMEIPDLVKLYGEYNKKGVEMLGVALLRRESPQEVQTFAKQNNMDWEMLIGDLDIAKQFNISSVPTTIFIDRNGKVMQVTDGPMGKVDFFKGAKNYETFKTAFEELVKK